MADREVRIDQLSLTSLYLKLQVNGNLLSTATGFVVDHQGKLFLITNWHVLSGRNPETDKPLSSTGGIPDEVRIAHHRKDQLGTWQFQGLRWIPSLAGSSRWIKGRRSGPGT